MKTLKELFTSLAKKAGVAEDQINKLTTDASLDTEVEDAIINQIEGGLLPLSVAKTHPEVRAAMEKVFKAELYNGLDAELNDVMTELGLTDAQKAEITAEKSSTKKAALLAKRVKEWEAAAHKDSGNADKKELLQKVNDLSNQLSQKQTEFQTALKAKDTELADKLLAKDMEFDLLGFNYRLPKETPASVKLAAAKDSVNRRLAERGLKVVVENGVRKIVRLDGTDYYDEHNKAVSYNDFISGALAQDNLLMASDDDPDDGKTKYPHKVEGNKDGQKVNQSLVDAANDDLANISEYMKVL